MTLHVVYSHQCPDCEAFYVPYDDAVPCPRCGLVEAERFDYIPQATQSMRYNKQCGGSYTPGAWWVSGLADHLLMILFGLFDRYEALTDPPPFAEYLDDALGRMECGDQEYMRGHLRGIALRVCEGLKDG